LEFALEQIIELACHKMSTPLDIMTETKEKQTSDDITSRDAPLTTNSRAMPTTDRKSQGRLSATAVTLGVVASIGGFVFGQ
jgi:hypothetical protein